MVWIYLAELVELQSPLEIGSDPSLIAKLTLIVKECSCPKSQKVTCLGLLFGETSQHSIPKICKEISISFMEDFPARISALRGAEKAWKGSEAAYFSRSCAFPKKSSPRSYSLRTYRLLPEEGDFESLEKLPKWGMIVDGALYPLQALERYIVAKGGSYLPTPVANDDNKSPEAHLAMKARMKGGPRKTITSLNVWVKMWPTPQACDATKGPAREYIPNGSQASMRNLVTLAARGENNDQPGGQLNPTWVEWLMGYQTEWTVLEPLVMRWFLSKRKRRSKS